MKSKWSWLSWIPAGASFLLYFLFLSYAFHIRWGLGHWPTPMLENYESPLFSLHGRVVDGAGLFAVAAPLLWIMLLLNPATRSPKRELLWQAALYTLGWICLFLSARFDPTTFTDWFMD